MNKKYNNILIASFAWIMYLILGFGSFALSIFVAWQYYFYKVPFLKNVTVFNFIINSVGKINISKLPILVQILIIIICIIGLVIVTLFPGILLVGIGDSLFLFFKTKRIDALNSILYDFETFFKKEHKVRKTGDEWLEEVNKRDRFFNKHVNTTDDFWNYINGNKKSKTEEYFEEQARRQTEEQFRQYYNYKDYEEEPNFNNRQTVNLNEDKELQNALAAFYFNDTNFTKEELKKTRNRLMKACHSDENGNDELSLKQSQKINKYFDLLKKYAK